VREARDPDAFDRAIDIRIPASVFSPDGKGA
jgi:hypothetical protein